MLRFDFEFIQRRVWLFFAPKLAILDADLDECVRVLYY